MKTKTNTLLLIASVSLIPILAGAYAFTSTKITNLPGCQLFASIETCNSTDRQSIFVPGSAIARFARISLIKSGCYAGKTVTRFKYLKPFNSLFNCN